MSALYIPSDKKLTLEVQHSAAGDHIIFFIIIRREGFEPGCICWSFFFNFLIEEEPVKLQGF